MNKYFKLVSILAIVFLLCLGAAATESEVLSSLAEAEEGGWNSASHGTAEFVPGEILLKLTTESVSLHLERLNQEISLISIEPLFPSPQEPNAEPTNLSYLYKLKFPADKDVMEVVGKYRALPEVVYAEPNWVVHTTEIPNDSDFGKQWGLRGSNSINAPDAWDIEKGDASVIIAIIDTGVDYEHPDLDANIWVNPGEDINGNGIVDAEDFNGVDDDGNLLVDDIRGWDWVNSDNDPQDDEGHGTHVAGIAAAETNNGLGVAGVTWNCQIMSLKALGSDGKGDSSDVAQAIIYATANGADVINLSLGEFGKFPVLEDAIASVSRAVVVAAAGNETPYEPFYPAAYSGVIAVAATDSSGNLASFSNRNCPEEGYTWVDVAAPGVSIWSTMLIPAPDHPEYASCSGTSMATPFVSGLAALLISHNPNWSKEWVRERIIQTVDNPNPTFGGLIDAYAALKKEAGISIEPAEMTVEPRDSFSVDIQINAGGWQVDGAQAYIDFDPQYLQVNSVTSGTALPEMLASSYDNASGTITYAASVSLGSTSFPSGTFTLATINFTALQENLEGTPITFVFNEEAGRMTKVTWAGENFIVEPTNGAIHIEAIPPVAEFTALPSSGAAPLAVQFTDQSTGTIDSWSWDFGDGGTSTEQHPSHTYTILGVYTVTLTVAGPAGSDIKTATITVYGTEFEATPTSGNVPLTVQFTDKSQGATAWSWDFGDGETSAEQSPSHTYTEGGTYTVVLTITGAWGSDTKTKAGYIEVIAVTLKGQVQLQGEAKVAHELTITLRAVEGTSTTDYSVTTDARGKFELTNLTPGNHDIAVDGSRVLRNIMLNVALVAPETEVDFGEFREGDANDDGDVDMNDFNLLRASFGIMTDEEGYNANANFDGNNIVDITDFSLLRRNYSESSDAW